MKRVSLYLWRLVLLAAFLACWQWLPDVSALRQHVHFLNPFFISSPEQVAKQMWEFAVPHAGSQAIWPYLWGTMEATLIGFVVGTGLGFIAGLVLSNMPRVNAVLQIYVVALNSVPRIALVPVIILIAGPGTASSVLSAVIVVFFITFFSAFEGGTHVPPAVLSNAVVMKASPLQIMMYVRMRYVVLWLFAVIPNAVAFSLIAVVTTEILVGSGGVGAMLLSATSNLQATVTMAVVIFLSIVGVVLLRAATFARQRILFWADEQ
jgi:NitT/TauT family transport system permease protein